MKIKLFENFHKGPEVLDSFQEAEGKLSDKDGIVLQVTGDMTHVQDAIKDIPHDECYVLITDQSSHVASSWKSDVFLVGGKKEGAKTIAEYFDKEWTDPAGGTHRDNDEDPALSYESKTETMKNIKSYNELNEGTMISKRNMDLDEFKSQGSFFNREPHSNDSPAHGVSISELNEERKNDLQRELENVITRYKTKMDPEAIFDVLHLLQERQRNEF